MWFKNIQLFLLKNPWRLAEEDFNKHLEEFKIEPLKKLERSEIGWADPFDSDEDETPLWCHAANGHLRLVAHKLERVLPASIINDELAVKLKALQKVEGRPASRREKLRLKDEVVYDLLPKALVRKTAVQGYIDTMHHWVLVDASSRAGAENWVQLLQETLGALHLNPLETIESPMEKMTQWVVGGKINEAFEIGDYCVMVDPKTGMSMIRCEKQDLMAKEVMEHIKAGKKIIQLALTWQDKISFVCDHTLGVKRIRFLDIVKDQRQEVETETKIEALDVDFALMTGEFSGLLEDLIKLFGGLKVPVEKKVTHREVATV